MVQHPIQLRFVAVKELHLETFWPIPEPRGYQPDQGMLQFSSSPFRPETSTVQVRIRFVTGRDSTPTDEQIKKMIAAGEQPFNLRVELVSEFHIDTTNFPIDKIEEWSKNNAPLILLPFLREQIYSLSSRTGFEPLILPMMVVPTLIRSEPTEELPSPRFDPTALGNHPEPNLRQTLTSRNG